MGCGSWEAMVPISSVLLLLLRASMGPSGGHTMLSICPPPLFYKFLTQKSALSHSLDWRQLGVGTLGGESESLLQGQNRGTWDFQWPPALTFMPPVV